MSDFSSYFTDPCELVTTVYAADGITELATYSLRGYAKNMNRFFQICTLFTWEMSYLIYVKINGKDKMFKTFADALRSAFYGDVKRDLVQQRIDDLRQYKFKSQRIFPFMPESDATSLNHKEYEITIDRIFKWIMKMRQHRIYFYERVLQEYVARKDKYNQQLIQYLESNKQKSIINPTELNIDSILSKLGIESENLNNSELFSKFFQISNQSWYLKDLMELENPEIERYTKRLPRYRTRDLHTHPEGLKAFFELFSIFRDEMSFILPDNPDESLFERVLTVLKRDFLDDFDQRGDLEDDIADYIEQLERFEFLSLPKGQFFDKLSKMIYNLRARRIAFYEAMLEDYLANKEKYDKAM
jgi:hypothetical protein